MNNREIKKEYLRKIIEACLYDKNYSYIVIRASYCLDDIRGIIDELAEEYHIYIAIIDFDYDKVKKFYSKKRDSVEIDRFVPVYPKPSGNVKELFFKSDIHDLSGNYYSDYSVKFDNDIREKNKELFEILSNIDSCDITIAACPNSDWAKCLYGSDDKEDDLWINIGKTLLDSNEAKKEIEERIRRKDELNKMKICNLSFYTNLGTDFRISLNKHSLWECEPCDVAGFYNFYNYPSYEIYTSPDCYSAEGKIVLSQKRRFYYNTVIKKATFEFSKGRLIKCITNSKKVWPVLSNDENRMNRIGEIALVSNDSPIAKLGDFYDSILIEENGGCHFALGDSIDECIGVSKGKIEKSGKCRYHYNSSKYHTDFVFGNDSISVEAELRGKKRVLLMENGRWKF